MTSKSRDVVCCINKHVSSRSNGFPSPTTISVHNHHHPPPQPSIATTTHLSQHRARPPTRKPTPPPCSAQERVERQDDGRDGEGNRTRRTRCVTTPLSQSPQLTTHPQQRRSVNDTPDARPSVPRHRVRHMPDANDTRRTTRAHPFTPTLERNVTRRNRAATSHVTNRPRNASMPPCPLPFPHRSAIRNAPRHVTRPRTSTATSVS
ncbi:hypothetical protein D9613_012817 [Agrocybe pediades]|uniref:Uncharacterized protein n=1 Tax=Agrocybe pediades TaxID=84607 RepID=A0A8H4VTA0_9AGAR|nr:hypothetical protein D9613_012817 [Agrocybe pediades]